MNRNTKSTNFILGTIGRADIAPNIPTALSGAVSQNPSSHPNSYMKVLLIFCTGFFAANSAFTQIKEPISINVSIIEKTNPFQDDKYDDYYFARLSVTNNQDTSLPVTYYASSWFMNWKSDNDSIKIKEWNFDGNSPIPHYIPPHKSLVFYATIVVYSNTKNKIFRMGFSNHCIAFRQECCRESIFKVEGNFFWSPLIEIKNNYSRYLGNIE